MTDPTALPWRTGRTLGRTMYARTGGDDYKADTEFGMLDTREIAARACADHNAMLDLARLAEAGHVTSLGRCLRMAPGGIAHQPCVSLEHLDLDELQEFYGTTFGEALAKAREWAEGEGGAT
jgi:hypothetical protein